MANEEILNITLKFTNKDEFEKLKKQSIDLNVNFKSNSAVLNSILSGKAQSISFTADTKDILKQLSAVEKKISDLRKQSTITIKAASPEGLQREIQKEYLKRTGYTKFPSNNNLQSASSSELKAAYDFEQFRAARKQQYDTYLKQGQQLLRSQQVSQPALNKDLQKLQLDNNKQVTDFVNKKRLTTENAQKALTKQLQSEQEKNINAVSAGGGKNLFTKIQNARISEDQKAERERQISLKKLTSQTRRQQIQALQEAVPGRLRNGGGNLFDTVNQLNAEAPSRLFKKTLSDQIQNIKDTAPGKIKGGDLFTQVRNSNISSNEAALKRAIIATELSRGTKAGGFQEQSVDQIRTQIQANQKKLAQRLLKEQTDNIKSIPGSLKAGGNLFKTVNSLNDQAPANLFRNTLAEQTAAIRSAAPGKIRGGNLFTQINKANIDDNLEIQRKQIEGIELSRGNKAGGFQQQSLSQIRAQLVKNGTIPPFGPPAPPGGGPINPFSGRGGGAANFSSKFAGVAEEGGAAVEEAVGGGLSGLAGLAGGAVAAEFAFEALKKALEAAVDAGLEFQKSVLSIASTLQQTTNVTGPNGEQLSVPEQVDAQTEKARILQGSLNKTLAPLGITGNSQAALTRSLAARFPELAQDPEKFNLVAGRLGAGTVSQRQDLLSNPTKYQKEIEDIGTGRQTSLTSALQRSAPGLIHANTVDELLEATKGLDLFSESVKNSKLATVQASRAQGELNNLLQKFGDTALQAAQPAIKAFADVLGNKSIEDSLKILGKGIGKEFSVAIYGLAGITTVAAAAMDLFNISIKEFIKTIKSFAEGVANDEKNPFHDIGRSLADSLQAALDELDVSDKKDSTKSSAKPAILLENILSKAGFTSEKLGLASQSDNSEAYKLVQLQKAERFLGSPPGKDTKSTPELEALKRDLLPGIEDALSEAITKDFENSKKGVDTGTFSGQRQNATDFLNNISPQLALNLQAKGNVFQEGLQSAEGTGNKDEIDKFTALLKENGDKINELRVQEADALRKVTEADLGAVNAQQQLRSATVDLANVYQNSKLNFEGLTNSLQAAKSAVDEFDSRLNQAGKENDIVNQAKQIKDLGGTLPDNLASIVDDPEALKQYQLKQAELKLNQSLKSVGLGPGVESSAVAPDLFSRDFGGSFQIGQRGEEINLQKNKLGAQEAFDKFTPATEAATKALLELTKVLQSITTPGEKTPELIKNGGDKNPLSNIPGGTAPGGVKGTKTYTPGDENNPDSKFYEPPPSLILSDPAFNYKNSNSYKADQKLGLKGPDFNGPLPWEVPDTPVFPSGDDKKVGDQFAAAFAGIKPKSLDPSSQKAFDAMSATERANYLNQVDLFSQTPITDSSTNTIPGFEINGGFVNRDLGTRLGNPGNPETFPSGPNPSDIYKQFQDLGGAGLEGAVDSFTDVKKRSGLSLAQNQIASSLAAVSSGSLEGATLNSKAPSAKGLEAASAFFGASPAFTGPEITNLSQSKALSRAGENFFPGPLDTDNIKPDQASSTQLDAGVDKLPGKPQQSESEKVEQVLNRFLTGLQSTIQTQLPQAFSNAINSSFGN